MKRILLFLFVSAVLAFTFASCDTGSTSNNDPVPTPNPFPAPVAVNMDGFNGYRFGGHTTPGFEVSWEPVEDAEEYRVYIRHERDISVQYRVRSQAIMGLGAYGTILGHEADQPIQVTAIRVSYMLWFHNIPQSFIPVINPSNLHTFAGYQIGVSAVYEGDNESPIRWSASGSAPVPDEGAFE